MPPASSSRIALFIDGANLHATSRTLGFDIDYKRLLAEFSSHGVLLRAFYYSAMDPDLSSLRSAARLARLQWLHRGHQTVPRVFVDAGGGRKVRGNLEVDLAVDVMELAADIDEMILFSGDGDFRRLIEAMQRRGVRVTVVSTASSKPPIVADELRRQADVFIDLAKLRTRIGRDPVERPAPRAGSERSPRDRTP